MTTYYAAGGPQAELDSHDLAAGIEAFFKATGTPQRVLALPPDYTRLASRAGELTGLLHNRLGPALTDVMPALGTHKPMTDHQLSHMFPEVPRDLIRIHRWRTDVVTLGDVSAEYVRDVTEGIYDQPWPAQVNKLLTEGGHDLILSIGQVVPHEVIGMANYNKNVFVGTGGERGISESHFLSAVWGIERTLGQTDTPLRRILCEAERQHCQELNIVYMLTVVVGKADGQLVTRGFFIGDDYQTFEQAAELAREVNFTKLERQPDRVVAYLDPSEFHSTWLGNKAVYRTRLAIADEGELIVLAPGVSMFGEDPDIDRMIRKYGYRPRSTILEQTKANADLGANLSAAAHLIHGSSENRFRITYAPGGLERDEIEGVGYSFADLTEMLERYPVEKMQEGWHTDTDGQPFYFIRNPALGLWAHESRL